MFAAAAADALTLGRQAEDSLVSDISQRIVTEAIARAGLQLVFKRLPLPRSVEAANDGEIDGDLHRIREVVAQFPNLMLVPTAVNRVTVAVYGASATIAAKTRAELLELRVTYPRGTLLLVKHSQGMAATDASTRASAIEMMLAGRVDLVMGVYEDIEPSVADNTLQGIHVWPHVWAVEDLYLVLNRRHALLVPRIDAALRQMKQEGLIARYYEEGLRSKSIRPLEAELPSLPVRPAASRP